MPVVIGRDRPARDLRRAGHVLSHLALVGVIAVIVALRVYVVRPVIVSQESMRPTLEPGDRVLVNTWATRQCLPRRGAVVVAVEPDSGLWVIKRVVAADGDSLVLAHGGAWLNGRALREPYVMPYDGDRLRVQVPRGKVFVLGDNRGGSKDSRDYGALGAESVIGEALAVIWPREHARWLDRGDAATKGKQQQ
jgi:signal peptidase I